MHFLAILFELAGKLGNYAYRNIPSSLVKWTGIYFLFNACKGIPEFSFLKCSILLTGGSLEAKMILFAQDGGAVVTMSALV
ncbi:MAG: hypothetical protein KJ804_06795 [Proteobacteria bacterium]|nr:hypothetical protein [Pseudomonadota bacterium]MBU1058008.1 hypothetical protein [Pseudomonadota bacterium]